MLSNLILISIFITIIILFIEFPDYIKDKKKYPKNTYLHFISFHNRKFFWFFLYGLGFIAAIATSM